MFDWTPDAIEKLRTAVAARKSASQTAVILGGAVSRMAVIGKARRLGLRFNSASDIPAVRAPRRKTPAPPRILSGLPDIGDAPDPAPHQPARKLLHNLGTYECRYPLFDARQPYSEQFYCGLPTAPAGGSWCAHCREIVFPKPKTQRA